jgi:Mg2+ and Co2+ transporter CorA
LQQLDAQMLETPKEAQDRLEVRFTSDATPATIGVVDENHEDVFIEEDPVAGGIYTSASREEGFRHELGSVAATTEAGLRQASARHTRRGRRGIRVSDLQSSDEHLWLVRHEVGQRAHIATFATVQQFAQHAHELLAPTEGEAYAPTKGALDAHNQKLTDSTVMLPQPTVDFELPDGCLSQQNFANSANGGDSQPRPHRRLNVRRGRMCRSSSSSSSSSSSESGKKSSKGKKSTKSSGSSSDSSMGSLTRSFWVDIQTKNALAIRRALNLFPLHQHSLDQVLQPENFDNLEAFTALNYIFVNIRCKRLAAPATGAQPGASRPPVNLVPPGDVDGSPGASYEGSMGDEFGADDDEHVVLTVIVYEDWIITLHRDPFCGQLEVFRRMKSMFGLGGGDVRRAQDDLKMIHTPLMTTAWILATLLDHVVESFLPDPTRVLAEVDSVDEMVLMLGSNRGEQDRPDLLRRIALLRRRISSQRAALFRKEQFVEQLLMPAMRTTFVSRHDSVAEQYKHTLSHVGHVAERLDAARDTLNQANSNFVSGISMSMSHSSTQTNLKMQLLSQVATICLPMNLLAGIMGMNVQVPFQNNIDGYDNLGAFWVILGIMGVWLLVMTPGLFRTLKRFREEEKADIKWQESMGGLMDK